MADGVVFTGRDVHSMEGMREIRGGPDRFSDVGGRWLINVSGRGIYQHAHETQITFTDTYQVLVAEDVNEPFYLCAQLREPGEVINYLNNTLFPAQFKQWEPPTANAINH